MSRSVSFECHSERSRTTKKYFQLYPMTENNTEEKLKAFARTLKIMDELRAQCPWDKKQTLETLRPLTIEETYELGDAILQNDMKGVKEELGDLFLHLVFY